MDDTDIMDDTVRLRLLTWNIRYDNKPDSISVKDTISSLPTAVPPDNAISYYSGFPEVPWSTRRITIAREVAFNNPDIFAVQESLIRQTRDLAELLPEFSYVGVGREDGKAAGEFVAIFYRRSAVTLQECDTFWLSPTPHVPSKFPGAGCIRCTTRARFITKTGGKVLTVMCTHWDHVSDGQRALAASLILYRGAHEAAVTGAPVFVLGDFNSPSDGADSSGYNIMTGNMEPVTIDKRFKREYSEGNRPDSKWVYKDVAQETAPLGRSGHHASFTDFKKHARMDHTRIDFVMAGGECWKSERYRVGESFWEGEDMGSDHRPVWADVVIG